MIQEIKGDIIVKEHSEAISSLRAASSMEIYDENPGHVACICLKFKN